MDRLCLEASTSGRPWQPLPRTYCGRRNGSVKSLHRYNKSENRRLNVCSALEGTAGASTPVVSTEDAVEESKPPIVEDPVLVEGNGASDGEARHQPVALDTRLITTFRWPAALVGDGQTVSISGTFTDWVDSIELIQSSETGDFVRSIALPPGTHQYKYKVDDTWRTSPCEAITTDGRGCFNNVRLVGPAVVFRWSSAWGGDEVHVTGDFTGWAEMLPLVRDRITGDFSLCCSLPAGNYAYQFFVTSANGQDPHWLTSPDDPIKEDEVGYICNQVSVEAPPAFHIFYATGWQQPTLNVRSLGPDGVPLNQEWEEFPMFTTPSRAAPGGGTWKLAVIPVSTDGEHIPKLEFNISNSAGKVDKPAGRSSYVCEHPGGYKLERGRLTPFPRARAPPTMLVSDLDGTMVGDSAWANEATREFSQYWESNAALCGGILVYNTGRSLGQFIALHEEKSGTLALPNALITAVGTKIFLLENNGSDRSTATGASWKEDQRWSRRLDQGWNLSEVKRVGAEVVAQHKSENACHWLDQGTEHPHRIALSVRHDKVDEVMRKLETGFAKANLQVRIIVSGVGDWRYIDCVSINGGKLEALEYVRTLFNVPRERCVAAGDSGNDILMLGGANPAIIVGNAQPELLDWLVRQPQDSRIVLTCSHLARGILEGLARLGLY